MPFDPNLFDTVGRKDLRLNNVGFLETQNYYYYYYNSIILALGRSPSERLYPLLSHVFSSFSLPWHRLCAIQYYEL